MSFSTEDSDNSNPQEVVYKDAEISHLAATQIGLYELSKASENQTPLELDQNCVSEFCTLNLHLRYNKGITSIIF